MSVKIEAAQVKLLRESTGAPVLDCREALQACNGELEESVIWLKKRGVAIAANKAGRTTSDGLVAIATTPSGMSASMVELTSETDFVAKNDRFQALAAQIAAVALSFDFDNTQIVKNDADVEPLLNVKIGNSTIRDMITEHIALLGENINLKRASCIKLSKGCVVSYVHNTINEGLGKIGVLVGLSSSGGDRAIIAALAKKIAMHIAAARPMALDRASLNHKDIEKEKEIFREQAMASGKDPHVVDKMVEGRMRKFFEEVVLLEQIFVIDGKTKISDLLQTAGKELGIQITIEGFSRFMIGEKILK